MHNGLSIFAAAPEPKTLITLHGFQHNDLYKTPTDTFVATHPNLHQSPTPTPNATTTTSPRTHTRIHRNPIIRRSISYSLLPTP